MNIDSYPPIRTWEALLAQTDSHTQRISHTTADAAHEQARDILAQWRAHTLAIGEDLEIGLDNATRIAEVFKVLSDPTRLYIVQVLIRDGESCVRDLAEQVEMSQSSVSHHLRILRHFRLVRSRRRGRQVLYASEDPHVERMLRVCLDHLLEG
jgi:ArsR family transcriptional regulator, lead/cadmium/zinc/bismuth-responsive transcriptional repressor